MCMHVHFDAAGRKVGIATRPFRERITEDARVDSTGQILQPPWAAPLCVISHRSSVREFWTPETDFTFRV